MLEHDIHREFGIFRSLCQSPDSWNWKKMCGHLDRWEYDWKNHDFQDLFLPYLRDQLAHWPADLPRYAQHHWVTHALEGRDVPQLEFCTAMQFVSQDVNSKSAKMLLKSKHLDAITYLDLRAAKIDRAFLELVVATNTLPKLTTTHVPGRHQNKYPKELLSALTRLGVELTHPG